MVAGSNQMPEVQQLGGGRITQTYYNLYTEFFKLQATNTLTSFITCHALKTSLIDEFQFGGISLNPLKVIIYITYLFKPL